MCGLTTVGAAYCWGGDDYGQVSGEISSERLRPIPVANSYRFVSLAAGWRHTCGVTTDSLVVCWGRNTKNQLGTGSASTMRGPTRVASPLPFRAIAASADRTCAVSTAGGSYCWGDYPASLLTDPITDGSGVATPARVSSAPSLVSIAVSWVTSCGVSASGQLFCWERIDALRLDQNTMPSTLVPLPAPTVDAVPGNGSACALLDTGRVYCWGEGPVGDGTTESRSTPVPVAGDARYTALVAGFLHKCAVTTTGAVHCWGRDGSSALGTASHLRLVPVFVGVPFAP